MPLLMFSAPPNILEPTFPIALTMPGEFVMTRPATRVLGARNLYKLMKEAEQMA